MDPQQIYLILRARWKFAAMIFGAVLFLTVLVTLLQPKMYTATSSVVVEVKADPVAGAGYQPQLLSSDVATQVDIIGSRRVAERVVRQLHLEDAPAFKRLWTGDGSRGDEVEWLADSLLRQLVIVPSKESNVIQISVKWGDAKTAASLANAFSRAYIETNIALKVDSAKQYAGMFDEQSRTLRADLEAKQRRLSDFQSASGIVATDEKLDVENARLSELSTQLVQIQALRQESQSKHFQASGDPESLPEVLQSAVIGNLKSELAKAEARRQDIGSTLGKNYPDYKEVEAQIVGLRERIAQESARIAASLGNTAQIDVRRESEIKAALDAQKQRILDLRHQHDQAADLQNDVTMAQHNLDAVGQRLAQSSLESQTRQTNIALLTAASEPLHASSPKLATNLLLGLFVGGVMGIAAALFREMTDRRVRHADELTPLLGIPLIGRIPDTTAEVRRAYAPLASPKAAGI